MFNTTTRTPVLQHEMFKTSRNFSVIYSLKKYPEDIHKDDPYTQEKGAKIDLIRTQFRISFPKIASSVRHWYRVVMFFKKKRNCEYY